LSSKEFGVLVAEVEASQGDGVVWSPLSMLGNAR